ncbi:Sec20-domain-containing protein [Xylariaceae sp. FL0255]|nr:Sec20-domain-containing protein [Xylariaceae sp. FL0255]
MSVESLEKGFADLQDRLNALQDTTNQLKDLIQRLANFDFQPGSVPFNAPEDDNVGAELSSEINQILREQDEDLELLHEDIEYSPPANEHDKNRLIAGVKRLEVELKSCHKSFHKAQKEAKHNLRLAQQQEQKLLYTSFTNPRSRPPSLPPPPTTDDDVDDDTSNATAAHQQFTIRRKQKPFSEMSKEEQMISSGNDVTQSLRRAHEMMAAELAKSDYARNTLEASTATLGTLSENYSSLDTMLSSSRALLGTLLKSQKTDTWYLQSAFYLLVVTIGWLIFRRLLWGPTWWLVYLPLKLVFRTLFGVSNAVGLTGSRAVESSPSVQHAGVQQARMNNERVPTISVDRQQPTAKPQTADGNEGGDMIEEVGKIIDESSQQTGDYNTGNHENGDGETMLRERGPEEVPNPKKRMMEEEIVDAAPEGRTKDEL